MSETPKRSASTADRRARLRRPPRATARVECRRGALGLGPNLAVRCLDVSETGLVLLLKAAPPPGTEVEVRIEGSTVKPLQRLAEVRWARAADGGLFKVGVRFRSPIDYATVAAVTASPKPLG